MKKNEALEVIKNGLELNSKKEAGEVLDTIDRVIGALIDVLDCEEKVEVGKYFALERKHIPTKEGICAGKPYRTEAHDVIKLKPLARLKRALEE